MAFHIQPEPSGTVNKTIRFPIELVEEIEQVIIKNHVSFSGFVIQACTYALNQLEDNDK